MHNVDTEDRYFRNPMWPYKEYKRIIYEPGRVARIKMNRPRYLNAQSHAMLAELEDAYDRASEDPECKVIVVSGEGRCWSAGDDTNGLTPESAPCLVTDETREELLARYGSESAVWHQYNIEHDYYVSWWLTQKLLRVPKPTIGMVHGYCIYGAFGHATSLDIVFASEDALFLNSGRRRAVWDIGPRKALEISYEHRFMTAKEAYKYHLINRIFPDHATLERETLAYASRVANETSENLHNAKRAYLRLLDSQGFSEDYDSFVTPWKDGWRRMAQQGHPMRYEGRGMARTPVAYYNLAMKLISEGEQVPESIIEALQRAIVRDDKGAWDRALRQGGRESERLARTEASAEAWQQRLQREGIKDIKERIADLLLEQGWGLPAKAQP